MSEAPAVQWVLRAGIAVGPVAALLLAGAAGDTFSRNYTILVVLLALVSVLIPASAAPAVTSLLVVVWWATATSDDLHPTVLAAAGCLLVAHVCALLVELGPSTYDVERATLLLWLRRGALLWTVAVIAWLVGRAGAAVDQVAGLWIVGAALAALLVVAASQATRQDRS